MGEIKINEYVRTDKGTIARAISNRYEYKDDYNQDFDNEILSDWYCDEKIIKHSPNIIDLIEEGDYVNGKQIIKILNLKVYDIETKLLIYDEKSLEKGLYRGAFKENDIKTIVTKEMFNQVKYEVN